MLTDEERQRIDDEERQRIAEEAQYRAQVRAELRQARHDQPERKRWLSSGFVSGTLVALIVALGMFVASHSLTAHKWSVHAPIAQREAVSDMPKYRTVPVTQNIATGEVTIPAGGYTQYPVPVLPEMGNTVVTGKFVTSGGSGNDIVAVLTDGLNFANWINGHQAQVYWQTAGQQTTGAFQVTLRPGTYYFGLSNRFSDVTAKQVFLNVQMTNYKTVLNTDLNLIIPPNKIPYRPNFPDH